MKHFLQIFFSFLLALSSIVQYLYTGEKTPVFTDLPTHEKQNIETPVFSMGAYDLVVSPSGSDEASGTLISPLRTIEKAKTVLAGYKASGVDCGEVHVWLRGGTYYLSDTLTFDEKDLDNVCYCAYPGEQVLLSGGEKILGGWSQATVNGVTAWVRRVETNFRTLYRMDGQALSRTRYPESGYFYVSSECHDGALYTPETTPWKDYMLGECAFGVDKQDWMDASSFRNPTDILVRLLHYWKDEMLPLKRYDADSGTFYSTKYCSMSPREGDRYYLENVFEALHNPGEWYLDRKAEQLYYIPFENERMEDVELYAGSLEKGIELYGVKNICFTGVSFVNFGWHPLSPDENTDFVPGIEHPQAAYSTPACITISNTSGIRFDACTFRNIGLTAIRFLRNVQNSAVTRCLFQNIGANAVYISGATVDNAQTTRDITVQDNHILQYGRNWANAIGVLVTHAKHVEITNNEIHDGYYSAISVGWVWGYAENVTDENLIAYNRIYDIGQGWLSDMGGIYTLGMQPHTIIRGNVISNVAADPGEKGYGGWGIYLDEGSSGILVEQNLVYDCGSQGFHQHYGKENSIRNNIFAMNRKGQLRVTRSEEHVSCIMERNIVMGKDTAMYTCVGAQKVRENCNFFFDTSRGSFVRSTSEGDAEDKALLHKVRTIGIMKIKGHYTDAFFFDPWFRDAEHFDFTLADNSFVLKNGFVPWDYGLAGTISRIAAQ